MRGGGIAPQNNFLDSILRRSNELEITFLIGNAALSHHPIIYSSDSFTSATGYSKKDVLHRDCSCQFLFGNQTDHDTIKRIKGTIDAKTNMQTEVVIYKKDKTPCWFLLQVSPIKNHGEEVILFLITFKDISHLKEPIEEPMVRRWSRLVQKSLAKHKVELHKSTDNAKSVFLQLAKKDASKKQKLAQLMSSSSLNIQYSWEGKKMPKLIIIHYSLFKTVWDWIILILTLYTAVVAPFVVSFNYHSESLVVFNLVVDSVFITDVIMNFRTTYVNKDNEIICNSKLICKNYLKSWFPVDFLAALPYGIVNLLSSGGWIEIINVIKVIRLIRLARIARKLDHYLEFGATTLVLWLFLFCLVAHWMACIWYVIAFYFDHPRTEHSWIRQLSVLTKQPYQFNKDGIVVKDTGPTLASLYMSSLYYCMSSLTTCGFGNIAPNTTAEKFFGCVTMLMGCFLYAFIFGQVTSIIQQLQMPSSIYHQKLNSIRRFIKLYSVPDDIGARLIDYFMTTWRRNKGLEIEEVLNLFPRDLQADVSVQIHKPVFEAMPEFRAAPTPALRSIARFFTTLRTAPGDRVIQQGETIDDLFIVAQGSLEVRKKGQIVGILGPGDVVGSDVRSEGSKVQVSLFDIHSLTYSDLHSVATEQLNESLALYPEFYRRFRRNLVYSFDLFSEVEFSIADDKKDGHRKSVETSFIERMPSTSSTSSQDQTMVEGDTLSSSLNQLISLQPRNTRTKPTLLSDEALGETSQTEVLEEVSKLRNDLGKTLTEINIRLKRSNEMMSLVQKMLQNKSTTSSEVTATATQAKRASVTSSTSHEKPTQQQKPQQKVSQTTSSQGTSQRKVSPPGPQPSTSRQQTADASHQPLSQQKSSPKSSPSTSSQAKSHQKVSAQSSNQATSQRKASTQAAQQGTSRPTYTNEPADDDQFVRQYKPPSNKNGAKKPKAPSLNDDLDEIEKALEEIELPDRNANIVRSNRAPATRNSRNTKQ